MDLSLPNSNSDLVFLKGGGEMGELIRGNAWAGSTLGTPADWHIALKHAVSIMLRSNLPMLICWGTDLTMLFNDAFRPVLGTKEYDKLLGSSAFDMPAETWGAVNAMLIRALDGETADNPDLQVKVNSENGITNRYFNLSCSPVADMDDLIQGAILIANEINGEVRSSSSDQENERHRKRKDEELQLMIDILPASVVVIRGPELVVEMINRSNLEYWNKSAEEVIGRPFLDILPDLADQPFAGQLRHVMATGEVIDVKESPVLFTNPDGTIRETFVDYTYQPLTDSNGVRNGVLVMSSEITDRVAARKLLERYSSELEQINKELAGTNEELATTNEELTEIQSRYEEINRELETSASRLRMAIESTNLGTWEYNPRTGELYWSKECRNIYGIPDGQPATFELFLAHIHPEDRPWVEEEVKKAMDPSGEGDYDLTYRIIRLDDHESRWIKAQGAVYFDEEQAVRFIGTVVDINEIKLAEEKSAKLAAIVATSNDAIISKTLDGMITSWNSSAQRVFGYTAEEMIGESIYKLIPSDRYEEEPQILATLKKGESVDHFETKRLTKDGRLIDVSVTISPVMDKLGQIIGASKIARDITERKLDEARKNDFIGMVSHELKTPLTSLSAMIQVANSKLRNSEDSFMANTMQRANIQVKRMTAMINGFLNISRLEAGKLFIEKQIFDIKDLIVEMIGEANLTLSTHEIWFNGQAGILVNADRDKIGSVISNLISNAVKYSPKGKLIDVACDLAGNEVIVSVKDEGIGIKPEDLVRIFDRYYRVETDHTRNISGFGIGLYLSSEIVERHGGKMWAESKSGVGSTFYFSLPMTGDQ